MVGIDICYNLHSAFGNWFPGSKTLILQVCGEVWICRWLGLRPCFPFLQASGSGRYIDVRPPLHL